MRSNGGVEDAESRFAALVARFAGAPDVEVPDRSARRRFGSDTLRARGSIFAMVSQGRLVVKLPAARVGALIADGTGLPFDGGKGRPMKEWLVVANADDGTSAALADEALDFARSRHPV
jgi:hypothetical protein